MNFKSFFAALGVCVCACSAQAFGVTSFSPQGEVARVRQVVVAFNESAASFGDPQAPAPLSLSCNEKQESQGSGRWISDKEWAFEFERDLPPGITCNMQIRENLQSQKGENFSGPRSYTFNTGGPLVQSIRPYSGTRIDEAQFFTLVLSAAANTTSVQRNVWCALGNSGKRVGVRLVEGTERAALLKTHGLETMATQSPLRVLTLACERRLNPSSRMQLVYGKGVATLASSSHSQGISTSVEQRFDFTVRAPFSVNFYCERANAQSPCLPLHPLALSFNAPVSRKLAQAIQLKSDASTWQPILNHENEAVDSVVYGVSFPTPLPEETRFRIELPQGFEDASGRGLHNAHIFPLEVATGAMPPLIEFAAAPFGIVQRPPRDEDAALLPVTLRKVEATLSVQGLHIAQGSNNKGKYAQPGTDAEIITWLNKVQRYNNFSVPREVAARDVKGALPAPSDHPASSHVPSRRVSLLEGQAGVAMLTLRSTEQKDPNQLEPAGIALAPGFHVVEIGSHKLAESLRDAGFDARRMAYVRTAVLVSNLSVHFKLGRENAWAWVTTLDTGSPVANARVAVSDCRGREIAHGNTNAQGLVTFNGISPQAPVCRDEYSSQNAYFVSARALGSNVSDLAFTWSHWSRGIEPWQFALPISQESLPDESAHTIFDRTLFRAGETVFMKHIVRTETGSGFGLTSKQPSTLVVTHVGSGQQYTQEIAWRKTATGGHSAESTFVIPTPAKLGSYQVELRGDDGYRSHDTGTFRVEEFRLPVLEGRIEPTSTEPLVNISRVPVHVKVNYVAGGAAAHLPVRVSALVRKKDVRYSDFEDFSFRPPQTSHTVTEKAESTELKAKDTLEPDARVIADKLPLRLDPLGVGSLNLERGPMNRQVQELVLEATYSDPNGEVQTIRSSHTLWPAAVVAGIKTENWASAKQKIKFQALALDLNGKPLAGVPLDVQATVRVVTTKRKRMPGGFDADESTTSVEKIGTVCAGPSDARGLLLCEASLRTHGEVELVVTAKDSAGRTIQAASSVYVTQHNGSWLNLKNQHRMEVIADKRSYQPGEVAKFQVRMPLHHAWAWVTVEREGVMHTQVEQLHSADPTIHLKIKEGWGPNVYVSVLAVGQALAAPAPPEPAQLEAATRRDVKEAGLHLGVAEIRVGSKNHQLDVEVKAEKESYPVRSPAKVTISVTRPDGKPAAQAEVVLAVVDQALLELMPNDSWDLLAAMLQRRAWGVQTSSAHMDVIGRKEYAKQAVLAADVGASRGKPELQQRMMLANASVQLDTQEQTGMRVALKDIFSTLKTIQLDANGQASVMVPLGNALSTFKIVAVADASTGLFGTGSTNVRTTQDLKIISGLPPLVRDGDHYRAQFTLRNTTMRPMRVLVTPRAGVVQLQPRTVQIAAQDAREVAWDVTATAQAGLSQTQAIAWEVKAQDSISGALDSLTLQQRVLPAVPLTVQQATLVQVDDSYFMDVHPPADALPGRGGLKMTLQPKLAEGLPSVRDWFVDYPFTCLEQKISKSIGLRDVQLWQSVLTEMPNYLDNDGLAHYFPPRAGHTQGGSDTLTAYVLAASHEAAGINPAFALSDALRAPMQRGLIAFVEGRIQRNFWSPRQDLDVRKLAAIEALSRYDKAQGRMLNTITIAPNQWPTHALIDWLNILQRVTDVPQRNQHIAQATQVLRARISHQGTKLIFSSERDDYWWWLMQNGDVNSARLILSVMQDSAWKDDMGRLVQGFINRQQGGAWHTTTANLWGGLALEKFSAQFENLPVTGTTTAHTGANSTAVHWNTVRRIPAQNTAAHARTSHWVNMPPPADSLRDNTMFLPWDRSTPKDTLRVTHQGTGKPWLTVQSVAAVALKEPLNAGYQITKTIQPMTQANKNLPAGTYTRGDVLRITLTVHASADMQWVVLSDPVPAGATILGSGLGRDSEISTLGEKRAGYAWPAFEERSFEALRSYYQFLPKGVVTFEYTVRLNNAGTFSLPPSRVEAMYAPEMFGATPNAPMQVETAP